MAAGHFVLTLDASIQTLASGVQTALYPPGTSLRYLSVQADTGNSHVVYVGGRSTPVLSSSSYGQVIPIPVSTVPDRPLVLAQGDVATLTLADVIVLGTNAEKIAVFYVT